MDIAVEAHGLTKTFGDKRVLDRVDLTVRTGSVFALLGPNGAGKTTLVRILATLVKPDGGKATVGGHDVVRDRHSVRRLISLTGQYAALDELQTGAENLRMMARLHSLSGPHLQTTAGQLLDRFDLTDSAHKRVDTYSGGMKRRLDLAMSLIGAPTVLFLDEPTTGLDLPSRQGMWHIVTDLAASGVTVFLTTQYLEEADQLADRIAVLDRGHIVAHGSADELKARVAEQRLDITAVDRSAYDHIVRHVGDAATDVDAARLTVGIATDGTATHVRSTLDAVDPDRRGISHFVVRAATLDDVFLTLTGTTTQDTEPAHV